MTCPRSPRREWRGWESGPGLTRLLHHLTASVSAPGQEPAPQLTCSPAHRPPPGGCQLAEGLHTGRTPAMWRFAHCTPPPPRSPPPPHTQHAQHEGRQRELIRLWAAGGSENPWDLRKHAAWHLGAGSSLMPNPRRNLPSASVCDVNTRFLQWCPVLPALPGRQESGGGSPGLPQASWTGGGWWF